MHIDANIQAAIGAVVDRLGTTKELADLARVDNSLLGKYRKGVKREITEETWERLYPHLAQYLPDSPAYLPRSMWNAQTATLKEESTPYGQHPCPPEIREICELWRWLAEDERTTIRTVFSGMKPAIQKRQTESRDSRDAHTA